LPLSLPKAPYLLLMAGLVIAGVLGVLVLHTKINENAFHLSDLRATQASLDQQEQQLEQQLADLSSPGNLRAAATRLGLVPAGDPAYIYLPDGRIVGVPQPAWGTAGP
jgi:cell division protein FtsL